MQFPTPEQRAAYVKGACGNDEKLRQHVEALLKAHEQAGGFLDQPHAVVPAKTIALTTGMIGVTEKPGDRIGRYKVLQQIGEGGCGVVYMAEQEEPVREGRHLLGVPPSGGPEPAKAGTPNRRFMA